MTVIEAKGFVQGKLDCMEKCDVFNKEDKHHNNECELCDYCYSQGNFGQQKEAFQMAINALENVSDDVCEWESDYGFISDKYKRETGCGYTFYDLHHAVPFKYCPYCGKKINVVE